jgi:8-oxo-dGTP pyrophosphatase MutT (NUDIX family)
VGVRVCERMRYARTVTSDLVSQLRAALSRPLPGLDAQLRMAPNPRRGWDPKKFPAGAQTGAALLLIYPHDGAFLVPLTVRGSEMRNHTGQVSLPGGRVDDGETIEMAALREAAEEIGVEPAGVQVIGRLTPIHIPVSGFILHPVVGVAGARPEFHPAVWEVARIIEVPVTRLCDPGIVGREGRLRETDGEPIEIEVPFFDIDGEKVWGATAMVLSEFCAILSAI